MTQAVCEVCAVSYDDVVAAAGRLPSRPRVLSLDPSTLGEVLADIPRLAEAAGVPEEGEELVEEAGFRIDAVRDAVDGAERPRVAALEWLDPVFIGGHWVPQMIELAGGVDLLGLPGEKSRTGGVGRGRRPRSRTSWCRCRAATTPPAPSGRPRRPAACSAPLGARVVAVDASAYFSRPGPRLVDGIELLAHLLHPGRVPEPPEGRYAWVDVDSPAAVG